jgi:hypothetical protein
VLTAYRLK